MAIDERSRERRNPVGPTAKTVGFNLKRLRGQLGNTQAELAERLREQGHPIPVASIGRIESGQRRVEVDDLTALAVALGVSPLALLLPNTRTAQEPVEMTGAHEHPADAVWRWALAGLPVSGNDYANDESRHLNVRRSFPWWLEPKVPGENDASTGLWLATAYSDWRTNPEATGFLMPPPPGVSAPDDPDAD